MESWGGALYPLMSRTRQKEEARRLLALETIIAARDVTVTYECARVAAFFDSVDASAIR